MGCEERECDRGGGEYRGGGGGLGGCSVHRQDTVDTWVVYVSRLGRQTWLVHGMNVVTAAELSVQLAWLRLVLIKSYKLEIVLVVVLELKYCVNIQRLGTQS